MQEYKNYSNFNNKMSIIVLPKKVLFMEKYKILSIFFVCVVLFSCQKEPDSNTINSENPTVEDVGILKFATEEDYNSKSDEIFNISKEERFLWEEQNGFKSFGSISEELYSSIDFESLKDIDELNDIVSQHEEYLELFDDGEGEKYLETHLYNSKDKYFVNKDKIFQVGDKLYKVYDDIKLVTNSENIDALKAVKYEDIFTNDLGDNILVFEDLAKSKIALKASDGCGTFVEIQKSSGAQRIKAEMTISVKETITYPNDRINWVKIKINFWARPYKRTLGIWYWCSRTIDMSVSSGILEYKDYYGTWRTAPSNMIQHPYRVETSVIDKDYFTEFTLSDMYDTPTSMQIRWKQYYFEAYTPSAGRGSKTCGM